MTEQTNTNQGTEQTREQASALDDELLTLAEVSRRLKITKKTLYAWRAKGKIRCIKIAGSVVRVPKSDLDAMITGTCSSNPPALV